MTAVLPAPVASLTALLAEPPAPPPGEGAEFGKAAPIGLLVILLLCLAVWFLLRNMSGHLRRLRERTDAEAAAAADAAATGAPAAAQLVAADAADPRAAELRAAELRGAELGAADPRAADGPTV